MASSGCQERQFDMRDYQSLKWITRIRVSNPQTDTRVAEVRCCGQPRHEMNIKERHIPGVFSAGREETRRGIMASLNMHIMLRYYFIQSALEVVRLLLSPWSISCPAHFAIKQRGGT